MKNILLLVSALVFFESKIIAQCQEGTAHQFLDINDVKARINNCDDLWWNLVDTPSYRVPKDSNTNSMYAGALWIGGLDQSNKLHVAANTYRQNGVDFFPGPLDVNGQVTSNVCSQYDSLWKINKSTIDSFKILFANSGGNLPSSQIPGSILFWPAHNNPFNPIVGNRSVAPFFDFDGNGIYDPTHGDYPLIKGDQDIFWVFNDVGNTHGESGGTPLGVEVHAQAYAYIATMGCDVSHSTFYYFDIENKSSNTYHDAYASFWVDYDIGNGFDDYLGCDSAENMSFMYNGEAYDPPGATSGFYGNRPPVEGVKILKVETTDSVMTHPFSSMMYYNNDFTVNGNPIKAADYYNYMQAKWPDSSSLTYGGTGYKGTTPTKYAFTGNPPDSLGWSECSQHNPFGDRRVLHNTGPLTLKPGDHIYLTYGLVWALPPVGTYPCPPFSSIDSLADCIQANYNNGTLSVRDINVASNISLEPNPAWSTLTIHLSNMGTRNEVSVYDMTGRQVTVSQTNAGNKIQLDVSSLASSVYIVVIKNANGNMAVKKFVKE